MTCGWNEYDLAVFFELLGIRPYALLFIAQIPETGHAPSNKPQMYWQGIVELCEESYFDIRNDFPAANYNIFIFHTLSELQNIFLINKGMLMGLKVYSCC